MSKVTRDQAIGEGYELAWEICVDHLSHEPTDFELEEEYQALCEQGE